MKMNRTLIQNKKKIKHKKTVSIRSQVNDAVTSESPRRALLGQRPDHTKT